MLATCRVLRKLHSQPRPLPALELQCLAMLLHEYAINNNCQRLDTAAPGAGEGGLRGIASTSSVCYSAVMLRGASREPAER